MQKTCSLSVFLTGGHLNILLRHCQGSIILCGHKKIAAFRIIQTVWNRIALHAGTVDLRLCPFNKIKFLWWVTIALEKGFLLICRILMSLFKTTFVLILWEQFLDTKFPANISYCFLYSGNKKHYLIVFKLRVLIQDALNNWFIFL